MNEEQIKRLVGGDAAFRQIWELFQQEFPGECKRTALESFQTIFSELKEHRYADKAISKAVQTEREACAQIAEGNETGKYCGTSFEIAQAIRERGTEPRSSKFTPIYGVSGRGVPQDFDGFFKIYPDQEAIDRWALINNDMCEPCRRSVDRCASFADEWRREHFPHQFILDPINPMDLSFVTENL